jgi:hypothetical protein
MDSLGVVSLQSLDEMLGLPDSAKSANYPPRSDFRNCNF